MKARAWRSSPRALAIAFASGKQWEWKDKVEHNGPVALGLVASYDYAVDGLGQRTGVVTGGSSFGSGQKADWTWDYNMAGEVTSGQHLNTAANSRNYSYDGIGNRKTSQNGSATPEAYATSATNRYDTRYTDTNGNGTFDSGEPVIASPAYDADGNMTADGISGAAGRKFVWDAENRLTEVWDNAPTSRKLARYTYDYRSRRVIVETTSDAPQGATKLAYAYDGWNVIAEYNLLSSTPTAPVKRHDWGLDMSGSLQGAGGVGGLLRTTIASNQHHVLCDGNGNVTDLRSVADGSISAHYEYDPFGTVLLATGSAAATNSCRFSSKNQDEETGFNYYGYRFYSARLGRWLNEDPIGELGGVNLFGILSNRTTTEFDYLGLSDSVGAYDSNDHEAEGSWFRRHFIADTDNLKRTAERTCSTTVGIRSLSDILSFLKKRKSEGRSTGTLRIEDHGAPGQQQIGESMMDPNDPLLPEIGKLVERIDLGGCRVAKGPEGEAYLKRLKAAFGKPVAGSPHYQLHTPFGRVSSLRSR